MTGAIAVMSSYGGVPDAVLALDFDAANYSAMPANGSLVNGYTVGVVNAGSPLIAWSADVGGVFRKTSTTTTDRITLGIDYSSASQSYTVFMAYKLTPASASSGNGRILAANTASPDWLLGSYAPGSPSNPVYSNAWYEGQGLMTYNASANGVFSGNTGQWNLLWATFNGTTRVAKRYVASASVNNVSGPSSAAQTATLNASTHGFNGLRLWNRENTFEPAMGDIGFVKVYSGEAPLSQVQSLWSTYHARFGI
jgi:hypothetical protein